MINNILTISKNKYLDDERKMNKYKEAQDFLKKHYLTNRAAFNNASNNVNKEVAKTLGGELIEIHSGTECFTWIIPDQWEVKKAYVKDLSSGKEIINFDNNPIHIWAVSESFKGTLTFDQLEKHLLYNKETPNGIPYHSNLQYDYSATGWGFSLSYNQLKKMNKKAKYEVIIDTEFKKGILKIADCIIPGKIKDTIFIAAHSCHPGQINDGLICVALGIDFFKWLKKQKKPHYTYRLIIGPEYFTGVAFLSHAKNVKNLKMGIFLDMIANNQPIVFSKSWNGTTQIDKAVEIAVKSTVDDYKAVGYRKMWGNDELFYDGPDFNIPTIGFGRAFYKEYHTSLDNLSLINWGQYQETLEILKKTVKYLEKNRVVERKFKGPVCMTRYGFKPGKYSNKLQEAQILMNKKNTLIDIAHTSNISFEILEDLVCKLEKNKLLNSKKIEAL